MRKVKVSGRPKSVHDTPYSYVMVQPIPGGPWFYEDALTNPTSYHPGSFKTEIVEELPTDD